MQAAAQDTDYKVFFEQAQTVNEQLQFEMTALKHQLDQLKKMIFGSKHERFVPSNDTTNSLQLTLGLEADTIAECKITDGPDIGHFIVFDIQ